MMEDLLTAQLLLSESEFQSEVSANTAALAMDIATAKIVYATGAAEKLFRCGVKNGLSGIMFEQLIPPELGEQGSWYVSNYSQNPHSRLMGAATMHLKLQALDGQSFPVAITSLPIKKSERLYVIMILLPLPNPETKDDRK